MPKITTFLSYNDKALDAAKLYVSIFKNSRIKGVTRYGDGAPRPKGSVMTVQFELLGQRFIGLNAGPHHKFTEAVSFYVEVETQQEIDHYWEKLTAGGDPAAQQCGWLKDKFGLSWQIVPANLGQLLEGSPEKSGRVMQALMQMKKLDIKTLENA